MQTSCMSETMIIMCTRNGKIVMRVNDNFQEDICYIWRASITHLFNGHWILFLFLHLVLKIVDKHANYERH